MLEFLKSSDKDSFYEFYQKSEMGEFIREIAPYINKRSYFKIENNGKITKKTFNYTLPLLAVLNYENEREIIDFIYNNCIDLSEKINIKKIDRLSNVSVEKLKNNLFKVLFNRDRTFVLRYCKELYLRDEREFYSSLYRYALMNDISSRKTVMIQSFEKLVKQIKNKTDIDYLLFATIDYIVNYESNLYQYQLANENEDENINIEEKNDNDTAKLLYFAGIKKLEFYSTEPVERFRNILFRNAEKELNFKFDVGYNETAENILLNNMNKGE